MSCLIEMRQMGLPEQAVLFQFVLKRKEWRLQDLVYRLQNCGVNVPSTRLMEICERWVACGWLRCTSDVKTKGSRMYRLDGTVDFPVLSALAVVGETHGWWKNSGTWYESDREPILRSLLTGGKNIAGAFENLKWSQERQWAETAFYVESAKEQRPFPIASFPPDAPDSLYRMLGTLCLTEGMDFSVLLEDWRNHHLRKRGFAAAPAAIEFMAHCVLAGRTDWLSEVKVAKDDGSTKMFREVCQALVDGDLARAYAASTPLIAHKFTDERSHESNLIFGMLAANLVLFLVTVFHKPVPTRVKSLAGRLCPYSNNEYVRNSAPRGMEACVTRRIHALLDALQHGSLSWYDIPAADRRVPLSGTAFAAGSLAGSVERKQVIDLADELLEAVERALRDHLPTLAGVILSVFGWAFDGDRRVRMEAAAQAVKKAGGVWFRAFDMEGQTPWKRIVAAFAERLPAKAKTNVATGVAKKGRIFWAISLVLDRYTTEDCDKLAKILAKPSGTVLECFSVEPYYRGPRGADDCSNDKQVTLRSVKSGKYDVCLTEADRAVLAAIEKERAEYSHLLPTAVLEVLATMDNVLLQGWDEKRRNKILAPIVLHRKTVPLTVASRADGGVDLAVPSWSLNVEGDRRIVHEGDGTFSLIPTGKQLKAVLDVFREFGAEAKVSIPKDGMAEMRPLMGRLGGMFPIQGELEAIGEGSDLERVDGEAKPLARLEFANDELSVALKVRPFAGAAELLFAPGAGQPERIVNTKGKTFVVVRDLAVERERAAVVRDALADFADWSVGPDAWRVDSLEAALGALVALKGLGDAVAMEWRGGEKLKVASLRPKGSSWRVVEGAADRWFSVQGEFAFDNGRVVSVMHLVEALANRVGDFVVFGDGDYLKLTTRLAKRLEALAAAGQPKKNAIDVPPAALPLLSRAFEAEDEALPGMLQERAEEWERVFSSPVEVPSRLKAQLRPYQEEGFVWLSRLAACGFGACLADDMGLGKTLQTIALLLARASEGPSLVVAPSSVCGNWRREIARFAPSLRTTLGWELSPSMPLGARDVVVASYGILVSRAEVFMDEDWNGVVLDEAQAIKNEAAKRSKTVKGLRSKFRVVATGTPVENRLEELWSLFDFLNPGLLGPLGSFLSRLTCDGRATPALKRLVSPFILRRLKRDVLADLPPKTEITIPVELDEAERTAYEGCRRHALEVLSAGGEENRISILAELTRLRRFCCHPSLVLPDFAISAKLEALSMLLADLKTNGHRALVFSQFTDYLAIVRKLLDANGWTYGYLDGATSSKDRETVVDAFQRGEGDFFLISLKAGGMGLNLTSANYVVLLDPWWNPAVENQAADRVHRIGQKNPVTVYRLIAADTVEERVLDLHAEKREMAEDVLDGTSAPAFTPEVLMDLFR